MFKNIELYVGKTVLVETNNEILTGTVTHLDTKHKILELDDVVDYKSNYQYTGSQLIVLPKIKNIQVIRSDEGSAESSDDNADSSDSKASVSTTATPNRNNTDSAIELSPMQNECCARMLQLSTTEMQEIQAQLHAIIVINQTDQSYHKALADIKRQSEISLLVEPTQFGRVRKTSLVVVATRLHVYIFDIKALGAIFRELKMLLEAERPRKVVHRSHTLVDHLRHQQGVKLTGISDTFVLHCIVANEKEPLTLIEATERYFNLPKSYFECEDKTFDINYRPLSPALRQYLAKIAIFQMKLNEFLIHKKMLCNFYKQCDEFAHTFDIVEDNQIVLQMQNYSREGFEHITYDDELNRLLKAKLELK